MFCSKCGANMKDSQKFCSKCGAANIKYTAGTDTPAQAEAKHAYVPVTPAQPKTPYESVSSTEQTMGFQPIKQEPAVSPTQETMDFQPIQQEPPVSPAQQSYSYESDNIRQESNLYDVSAFGEFVPAGEQPAAPAKRKKKKGLTAFIVITVILVLLAGGVLIFMQTDFYKIKKAEYLIGKGELGEAKSTVAEVSSIEADTLGAYIDVLEKRQDFLNDFNASKETAGNGKTNLLVCTAKNSELYTKSNAFLEAFKTFQNEKDCKDLPKSMQEDYNYCQKVIDSLYDTGFNKEMFYKVQSILLEKVEKNKADSFTLKQVQESVEETENAYKQIDSAKNTLKNISAALEDEYISLSGSYYKEISGFVEAMDTLAETAKAEADNEQQAITDDLKKNSEWTMETNVYLPNKDENYTYSFGQYFEPISDEQSVSDNADLVMNSLQVGILGLYLNHVEEA